MPALNHRVLLKPEAELEGVTQVKVCEDIANEIPCPVDEISDEYEEEEYEEEENMFLTSLLATLLINYLQI